jgi:hypothetical protein
MASQLDAFRERRPEGGFSAREMLRDDRESWKDIADFPGYQVSDLGRVRSFWQQIHPKGVKGGTISILGIDPHLLSVQPNTGGYLRVLLQRDGRCHKRFIHHLVLEAFVGQRKPGNVARHGERGNECNEVSNLCWGTAVQNNREDKIRDGTLPRGEVNGRAKLTEEKVRDVRRRLADGEKQECIARDLGVARATISSIAIGKSWRHLS